MQVRLYIDEDAMSHSVIAGLRARDIDVTSVIEEGRQGLEDVDQLEFAIVQERVIYTCNARDFYRLHTEYLQQGKMHAGIIIITQQRYGIGEQIRRLLKLISTKSAEEMEGQAEFLSDW